MKNTKIRSFRFDEVDQKMLEEAHEILKNVAKSDIAVIRYCLNNFLTQKNVKEIS